MVDGKRKGRQERPAKIGIVCAFGIAINQLMFFKGSPPAINALVIMTSTPIRVIMAAVVKEESLKPKLWYWNWFIGTLFINGGKELSFSSTLFRRLMVWVNASSWRLFGACFSIYEEVPSFNGYQVVSFSD